MSELFWCRLHDDAVEIPEQAIQIETKTKTYRLFKFPDGSIHDLRKPTNTKITEAGHVRLHEKQQLRKPGCKWCYPPDLEPQTPQAVPEPQENTSVVQDQGVGPQEDEMTKVISEAMDELSNESQSDREPEKVIGIGRTQMQAAFERLRSNRNAEQE